MSFWLNCFKMKNDHKISIVITCYNIEKYVVQCIDSIVNQSYTNLEIIIVNDGSTDKTLEIINNFKESDSRIEVINQKNQGVSFTRNNGLNIATGHFLMFIDGDDWLETNTIEKIYEHSNYDLVCFSFVKEYPNKKVIRNLNLNGLYESYYIQRRVTGLIKEELFDPSHLETLAPVWGKFFKTEIIKNNNIIFKNINEIGAWEDGYFVWDYLNCIENVFVLNEPFYHYRKIQSGSITSSYKKDFLSKTNFLFELLSNDISKNNKSSEFDLALNNRICLSVIGLGINETLNNNSFFDKKTRIKLFLKSDNFVNAFKSFELKYFPLHWKLFFFFAKKKLVFPLLIMLIFIKKIIKK